MLYYANKKEIVNNHNNDAYLGTCQTCESGSAGFRRQRVLAVKYFRKKTQS